MRTKRAAAYTFIWRPWHSARAEQACLLLLGVGRACASVGGAVLSRCDHTRSLKIHLPAQNFKVVCKKEDASAKPRAAKACEHGDAPKVP